MQFFTTTLWQTIKNNGSQYDKISGVSSWNQRERNTETSIKNLSNVTINLNLTCVRFLCCLDETWFNTKETKTKGWIDNSNKYSMNVTRILKAMRRPMALPKEEASKLFIGPIASCALSRKE